MNNLHVISKQNPIQLFDEVGSIENGYDITGIDDSVRLNLDDSDGEKWIEHRYHNRFQIKEDAFALIRSISAGPLNIRGKSMGCIACAVFDARPARLGKIDNISMGGLMFHYVDSKTQLSEALALDILLAGCGFYLANIPYKTLTDVVIPEDLPGDPFEMRQVRLQFQKLSVNHQVKLKDLISNHGVETGEIGVKD